MQRVTIYTSNQNIYYDRQTYIYTWIVQKNLNVNKKIEAQVRLGDMSATHHMLQYIQRNTDTRLKVVAVCT